jgi:hypothetical protein
VIETKSEEGSDGDWSEHGQVLLGVGQQKGITQKVRQRQKEDTRLVTDNEKEVSDFHSNSLGKSTGDVAVKVKNHVGDSVVLGENNRDDKDMSEVGVRVLPSSLTRPRGSGRKVVTRVGPMVEEEVNVVVGGPGVLSPAVLRTREGDIPLGGPLDKRWTNASTKEGLLEGVESRPIQMGLATSSPNLIINEISSSGGMKPNYGTVGGGVVPSSDRCIRNKSKYSKKKVAPYLRGHKFLNQQNLVQRNGGGMKKRKAVKGGTKKSCAVKSVDSDPIQSSTGQVARVGVPSSNPEGIQLEVVLVNPEDHSTTTFNPQVQCPIQLQGGSGAGFLATDSFMSQRSPANTGDKDVDRGREEAYHIIDIQEKLGMNFKGVGDEDVARIMAYEERDCREKLDWEQREVDQ